MKKISILLLILVCSGYAARAQALPGMADLSSVEILRDGDQADVSFRIEAPARIVKGKYTLALLPVITDGEYRVSLPAVIIPGKRAEKSQVRYGWVSGREIETTRSVTLRPGTAMNYSASVEMQPWMENATLVLENMSWGCCSSETGPVRTLAENILPPEPVEETYIEIVEYPEVPGPQTTGDTLALTFRFVIPESEWNADEPIYDDDREKALIVYYQQNSSTIHSGYGTNQLILTNLLAAVNSITGSPDSEVSRIIVAGFASPEGAYTYNDRLAWERAVSVKEYIMKNTTVPDAMISLYNGSEDWSGLRALVAASEIADKAQVLKIIDTVPALSADGQQKLRLQRLQQLNGGATYRYLYDNFFPRLRNGAFIRVYYRNR